MTPKEYLLKYQDAVNRANAAMRHLEKLREMTTRITPNYGSIGISSHQTGDKLGDAVAKMIDAESRVSDEIEMLTATEREVTKTIVSIDDSVLRILLYEKYINCRSWEEVSVIIHYSRYHTTHILHPRALEMVKLALESTL